MKNRQSPPPPKKNPSNKIPISRICPFIQHRFQKSLRWRDNPDNEQGSKVKNQSGTVVVSLEPEAAVTSHLAPLLLKHTAPFRIPPPRPPQPIPSTRFILSLLLLPPRNSAAKGRRRVGGVARPGWPRVPAVNLYAV